MLPLYGNPGSLQYHGCPRWAGQLIQWTFEPFISCWRVGSISSFARPFEHELHLASNMELYGEEHLPSFDWECSGEAIGGSRLAYSCSGSNSSKQSLFNSKTKIMLPWFRCVDQSFRGQRKGLLDARENRPQGGLCIALYLSVAFLTLVQARISVLLPSTTFPKLRYKNNNSG